ncbi:MAG: serine/threonine protein kinase [Planctomycetota bacterium]|nr:MAG: serine/threonine protein kinase [Planctomycetota bacterium]
MSTSPRLKSRFWCSSCLELNSLKDGSRCRSCGREMESVELISHRYVFQAQNRLGRGVIKVWDVRMRRWNAIKFALNKKQYQAESGRSRFEREIWIQSQLEHPFIVTAYDVVDDPDYGRGIVMPLVLGLNLFQLVSKHGPLKPRVGVELMRDLSSALAYMHRLGIIHRDITPANIIVEGKKPVLIDFGLAKRISDPPFEDEVGYLKARNLGNFQAQVTIAGQILGTPIFMAPEQVEGSVGRIDQRTDLYGVGSSLYFIITGVPPFQGESIQEIVEKVLYTDPVPPCKINSRISSGLNAIILKAIQKERERRFQSAQEIQDCFQRWLDNEDLPPEVYRKPLGTKILEYLERKRKYILLSMALIAILFTVASYFYLLHVKLRAQEELRRVRTKGEEAIRGMGLDKRWAWQMLELVQERGDPRLTLAMLDWMEERGLVDGERRERYVKLRRRLEERVAIRRQAVKKLELVRYFFKVSRRYEGQLDRLSFLYLISLRYVLEVYRDTKEREALGYVQRILEFPGFSRRPRLLKKFYREALGIFKEVFVGISDLEMERYIRFLTKALSRV